MLKRTMREFITSEAAGGIVLCFAAVAALIIANSPLDQLYKYLLDLPFAIQLGNLTLSKPLTLWVNEGLMVIFFLLVGLEIKREIVEGELNSLNKMVFPGIAAIGGMIVPGLIYIAINFKNPIALHGWAISSATDIAFALGVLALLGKRIPVSLKLFLASLAILDDIGAIVIIAVFYTAHLSFISLGLASLCILVLIILNRAGVDRIVPYILVGLVLWVCVLKSGVHATLVGIVLAFAIPTRSKKDPEYSPLRVLEKGMFPWVAFGVLPLFAFINAGVSFEGVSLQSIINPVSVGIVLGLFLGKQLGVFGTCWLLVKMGCIKLPRQITWKGLYGVALVSGIGFTMSLFITTLAFNNPLLINSARVGILVGSLLSGIAGYLLLRSIKLK